MADQHPNRRDTHVDPRTAAGASSVDRRTMLKGIAIAGAAVPILVACGSDSSPSGTADSTKTPAGRTDSSPSAGDPTTTAGSGGGGGAADVIAKASDVPVGGGVILPEQTIVVTQPTAGTFEGFSSTCTHAGCTVASISGGTINCPCHGSRYSIKDGSVVGGPAPAPLPKKPVKDQGGNIVSA
jgi:Rieske Fe-S protein